MLNNKEFTLENIEHLKSEFAPKLTDSDGCSTTTELVLEKLKKSEVKFISQLSG